MATRDDRDALAPRLRILLRNFREGHRRNAALSVLDGLLLDYVHGAMDGPRAVVRTNCVLISFQRILVACFGSAGPRMLQRSFGIASFASELATSLVCLQALLLYGVGIARVV